MDNGLPVKRRVEAIGWLNLSPSEDQIAKLVELLGPRQPQPVQMAAITALANYTQASVAESLLGTWPTLGPSLRSSVVELLFAR